MWGSLQDRHARLAGGWQGGAGGGGGVGGGVGERQCAAALCWVSSGMWARGEELQADVLWMDKGGFGSLYLGSPSHLG